MTPPDGGQAPSNVVAFQPRAAAGDWTAAELQRLAELSRKLEAEGAHVGAVYGVSDAGDPWCVITNDADEVLMHVARIGGRFVIHDATADALQDGDSLWTACDRLLGQAWRDGREDGVVIPLHQAQALLALVAALIFEHDGRPDRSAPAPAPQIAHGHAEPAGAALTVVMATVAAEDLHVAPRAAALASPDEDVASLRTASLAPMDARGPATSAAPLDPATSPGAAPTHAVAADPVQLASSTAAPEIIPGQSLDGGAGRVLTGGHGGDVLVGGPGDDTLSGGGAGHGQVDLLLGGGGADRLIMAERTVAIGGPGHDVFVFSRLAAPDPHPQLAASLQSGATAASNQPPPSLTAGEPTPPAHPTPEHPLTSGPTDPPPTPQGGVIMDFTTEDRLDFGPGGQVMVVGVKAVSDVLAGLHGNVALSAYHATPGEAVSFDFNSDGVADLTVLMAGPGAATLTVGTVIAGAAPLDAATDHAGFMASIHTLLPGAFLLG